MTLPLEESGGRHHLPRRAAKPFKKGTKMLIDRIRADQLVARKARDSVAAALLTTLIGEATTVTEEEFEKARAAVETDAARVDDGAGSVGPVTVSVPTTDEKVTATIVKFLKNARANRDLMLASDAKTLPKVEREIELLSAYLPQQMTEDELRAAIDQFRRENPGAGVGTVMAFLKASHAGLYDGRLASQLAKA